MDLMTKMMDDGDVVYDNNDEDVKRQRAFLSVIHIFKATSASGIRIVA